MDIQGTKAKIVEKLANYFGVTPSDASLEQMYKAVSLTVLDILLAKKKKFNHEVKVQKKKRVYYLCMEFLVGRSLKTLGWLRYMTYSCDTKQKWKHI